MTLPATCKTIYSVNDGNYTTWDLPMQKAVDAFKFHKPPYTGEIIALATAPSLLFTSIPFCIFNPFQKYSIRLFCGIFEHKIPFFFVTCAEQSRAP
jgi:hypothetical protein